MKGAITVVVVASMLVGCGDDTVVGADGGPAVDSSTPAIDASPRDATVVGDGAPGLDAGGADAGAPCVGPACTDAGGADAGAACVGPSCPDAAVAGAYSTSFTSTEYPISEGGAWIDGSSVGLDWNAPETESGNAHARVRSGATGSRYDDSVAHLSASFVAFDANQYAQGTVYRVAGYAPAGSKHEIELLLRFDITAHDAHGYEVLWGWDGDFAIVRWNGPLGDYTALFSATMSQLADGDVVRAEISGSVITVYRNGTLVATGPPNTTWASGQPGIGFWPVDSSTPGSYGWRDFEAGNL